MLKFFAKYQKIILVVGGSILMVAFLLPGAEIFLPDPAGEPIGTIDGEQLTGRDQQEAAQELQLLEQAQRIIAVQVRSNPRQVRLGPLSQALLNSALPGDALQWLLIQHEAPTHGVYVAQSQGHALLLEINNAGVNVGPLIAQGGEDAAARALARWQTYVQFQELLAGGVLPSEPRLRHLARDVQSRAAVKFVALDPEKIVQEPVEPTEQQFVEQFEAYKDQGSEGSESGYGYRLPPRVKLHYIAVPRKRIAETIQVDEPDAYEYYTQNPREFYPPPPKPEPASPTTEPSKENKEPAAEEKPSEPAQDLPTPPDGCQESGDSPAPDPNKPLPYRQVRQQIIDKLTEDRARARQAEIVKFIQGELSRNVNRLAVEPSGYRVLPPDHHAADFEALAARVQERYGVLPDVVKIERWLDQDDVAAIEGLGRATVQVTGFPLPVAFYVMSARELKTVEAERLESLRLQVGVPSRPAEDPDGAIYIFQVTEAQPEHVPASIDEVREQVIEDVRQKLAYEVLKQRADEFLSLARTEGLDALAEKYDAQVTTTDPFAFYGGPGEPPMLPVVGASREFVQSVFELARQIDEEGGLDAVEPARTFTAVSADRVRRVCIVKLTSFEPVNSRDYAMIRPSLARLAAQTELQGPPPGEPLLSLESLKKRTGFTSAYRGAEESSEPAEPDKNVGLEK